MFGLMYYCDASAIMVGPTPEGWEDSLENSYNHLVMVSILADVNPGYAVHRARERYLTGSMSFTKKDAYKAELDELFLSSGISN